MTSEQEMARVLWQGIFAAAERRRALGGGVYEASLARRPPRNAMPGRPYCCGPNCCPELLLLRWPGAMARGKELWRPIEGYEWVDVVAAAAREGLITTAEGDLLADEVEGLRPYLWPSSLLKGLP